MGRTRRQIAIAALASLAALAAFLVRCGGEVPLTATEGAELSITANPTAIPVFGGVSTITIVGFKSAEDGGGPLTDGTQIFLTTDVGVIEERVELRNGVARGNLRSNGRAGLATVTARSGAGISATLEDGVLVGNAEGINILLTANPPTVTPPNTTTELVATVFDNDNNRMEGVPIIFTTDGGALASAGTTLRTNALGQATDRLTLLPENTTVDVIARSGAIASNQVTVNFGEPVTTISTTTTTSTPPTTTVSTTTVATTTVAPPPIINTIFPPASGSRDPTTINMTITGSDFQTGANVSFSPGGITVVGTPTVTSTQITLVIRVDALVPSPTSFDVTVTNPDGGSDTFVNGFIAN
jgi:hypothetical protein